MLPAKYNDALFQVKKNLVDLTKHPLKLDKRNSVLIASGVKCPLVGRQIALAEFMLKQDVGKEVKWSDVWDAIKYAGMKRVAKDRLRATRNACDALSTHIKDFFGYKHPFLTVENKKVRRNF